MKKRLLVFVLVLFSFCVAQDCYVLQNFTLIDGNGHKPKMNTTMVIKGDKIIAVTTKSTLPQGWQSCEMTDLNGSFVMPGLIDTHVHVSSDWPQDTTAMKELLKWALLGGITNMRDMAGDAIFIKPFADEAASYSLDSPRIYFSALLSGPSFFTDERVERVSHGYPVGTAPWMRAIDDSTNFPEVIGEAKRTGATGIKLYANLPPELVLKATQEAHNQSLHVWSHAAIFPAKPSDASLAGVDVLSHAPYLVWESVYPMPDNYTVRMDGDYDSIPYDNKNITQLLLQMSKQKQILDSTLWVFTQPQSLKRHAARSNVALREEASLVPWMFNITRLAKQLGVRVCTGTDDIGVSTQEVPNVHYELELLVSHCNFTTLEAITAATKHSAAAIGISNSFGTLEAGKIADLLVLTEDPTKDIRNTRSISFIMKGGRWYEKPIKPLPSPDKPLLDARQITVIVVCVALASLIAIAIAIAVYTTLKHKKLPEVETPLLS